MIELQEKDKMKFAVILPHCLKKVGARHKVKVFFSTEDKERGICPAVRRFIEPNSRRSPECTIHHSYRHNACASGVVNRIPLS